MATHVGAAVVSEITSRAVSKIFGMINKQTAIDEKLRKLEMLCIKIHGAVETSKKHRIAGNYLLKWQEKLKEAATDGDEVLFSFRWRALDEASRDTNHQISTLCALAYTKIAMSSMKLNSTVERLERLSADIDEFLGLVDLEDLMEEEHAPAKRKNPVVICDSPSLEKEEHRHSNRKRALEDYIWLIRRFGKQPSSNEKLQRLEMLLIKIHSAVEASEKRTIKNLWLLQWRDKLKEATSQGDEVLASFRRRVEDAEATSSASANANQQQGESSSSSVVTSATAVAALSFTRNSLSGVVQGVHNATQMLFSSDEDMERLNSTLDRLEKLSPDIGEFIRLFQLETWAKVDQTPTESMKVTTTKHGPPENKRKMRRSGLILFGLTVNKGEDVEISAPYMKDAIVNKSMHIPVNETSVIEKEQQGTLLDRLEEAFANICKTVELADSSDLEDMEWLASWANILREGKEQGCAVLSAISAQRTLNAKDNKESMVERDPEKDGLGSFVDSMEALARDVECFSKLVYMCPSY